MSVLPVEGENDLDEPQSVGTMETFAFTSPTTLRYGRLHALCYHLPLGLLRRTMSFVMPKEISAAVAPTPRNPRIGVSDVADGETLAVCEFPGEFTAWG